jgi:hypothetical protein
MAGVRFFEYWTVLVTLCLTDPYSLGGCGNGPLVSRPIFSADVATTGCLPYRSCSGSESITALVDAG